MVHLTSRGSVLENLKRPSVKSPEAHFNLKLDNKDRKCSNILVVDYLTVVFFLFALTEKCDNIAVMHPTTRNRLCSSLCSIQQKCVCIQRLEHM